MPQTTSTPPSTRRLFFQLLWRSIPLTLGFLLVFFVLTAGVVGVSAWFYLDRFTKAAGITPHTLWTTLEDGWKTTPLHDERSVTRIVVLGTDEAPNRAAHPTLTDSVMIATIAHHSGQVSLTALPRDLWSEAYKTRINALYLYGRERMPEHPTRFVQDVLSELIGSPLHYVIVLSPHQVAEVIDLVGGIELTVPSGFVDHTYPRDDVDITKEKDPAKLYETVTFTPGTQRMDGQVAMKYMRSRHAEGTEGTDTARSARQQLVIQALLQRLRQRSLWEEPQRLGKLYAWYNQQYRDTFPLAVALGLLKTTLPESCLMSAYRECPGVSLQTKPVTMYPEDPHGMIEHPDPRQYKGEWVYTVRDLARLRQLFQPMLQ